MKGKLLSLIISFFFLHGLYAQKIYTGVNADKLIPGSKLIRYVERTPYPNHIVFANKPMEISDHGQWIGSIMKLPKQYSLVLNKQESDNIGFVHQEYKQYYQGVLVENGVCKMHIRNQHLESISGDIYEVGNMNVEPSVSISEAIIIAKKSLNAQKYKWEEGRHNSFSYYPVAELVILTNKSQTYLTYKVDIYAIQPLTRKYIYVDAHTGNVIQEIDRIHQADVPATATTAYSGVRPIVVDFNGTDYTLSETGRGLETINYATTLPYNNPTTTWNLVGLDQYALDAHWGGEMTYDYYFNTYGRDGLDNAHYFLTCYVNEGPGFGNAYWDGTTVHFGDGDGVTFTTPLTSIGIVGHEMTHGLTQFTAGLVYANESGAMNESFSDIFGLCIDKYARNIDLNLPASWLVGAECTSGTGIRNMANPNAFGNADTYGGLYWNAGDIVHYDSGVQNFWFYLLTMGGSGTNDNTDVYNVTGIGVDDAGAIAYRNLVFYLTAASDFADSRYYSLIAAQDLFGSCSPQLESTANAWYAVGVGLPYQNVTTASFSSGNPISCSLPINVNFTNLSFNGLTYLWNFGDGDTSSLENPIHAYAAAGTYTVELIVNGCGVNVADTFSTFIMVSTGTSTVNLDPVSSSYVTCCSGNLYDSGGLGGDYTDSEASSATLTVPAGNILNIDFTAFSLEDTYDFLYLYDGPDGTYPLIGAYTGSTLPNGGATIISTSNSVYVEFASDGSVTDNGFELSWYCTPPSPPVSNYTSTLTTVCIGSTIEYYNNSSYEDSINWDFQGGSPLSSNSDTVLVTYNSLGVYTTTLTASNILGTNSSTSTITVVPLPSPSISLVGNVASITPAFAGYQWYMNGNPIGGATSQNYTITQGGSYYCVVTDDNNCSNSSTAVISTLGLSSQDEGSIIIYPNPASNYLFINNGLLNGFYQVSITNVLGEVIFTSGFSGPKVVIDLALIPSGSYFVKIRQDEVEVTKKVIVVK